MTADRDRLDRIGRLTRAQAISALQILAGYTREGTDFALDTVTAPVVVATVTPINANVQPVFCADCGAPEGTVPLVCEGGVVRCWDAERCDLRQAQAAGYRLTGGAS